MAFLPATGNRELVSGAMDYTGAPAPPALPACVPARSSDVDPSSSLRQGGPASKNSHICVCRHAIVPMHCAVQHHVMEAVPAAASRPQQHAAAGSAGDVVTCQTTMYTAHKGRIKVCLCMAPQD